MNSNPTGGLLSPDIRAYWKFAADPANDAKSVVEVNGPKISIARLETPSLEGNFQEYTSYLGAGGVEYLSQMKKAEVVAHFKEALGLKYEGRVSDFFTEADEQEALRDGVAHHLVQRVAERACLYESLEQVKRSHQELEQAYKLYIKQGAPSEPGISSFESEQRQEAVLSLAEAYLNHQACVADIKAMAEANPGDKSIQDFLNDESMLFKKTNPTRIASALEGAIRVFFAMAQQSFNKIGYANQGAARPHPGLPAKEELLELKRYYALTNRSWSLLKSIFKEMGASSVELEKVNKDQDQMQRQMLSMLSDAKEIFEVNYRLGRWGASRDQFEKEMFLSRQNQAVTPLTVSSSSATAAALEPSSSEELPDGDSAKKEEVERVTFAADTKPLAPPRQITEEELKQAHAAVFEKIDEEKSLAANRPTLQRGEQVQPEKQPVPAAAAAEPAATAVKKQIPPMRIRF